MIAAPLSAEFRSTPAASRSVHRPIHGGSHALPVVSRLAVALRPLLVAPALTIAPASAEDLAHRIVKALRWAARHPED